MPRWIDAQASKGERAREAKAAHDALVARHAAEREDRRTFAEEQDKAARSRAKPKPKAFKPGERRLPDFSDEELRQALGKADHAVPRMLDYPHLLIFRERGFTRQVWADAGAGEFGAPSYRGDILTEVGERWLNHE